MSGLAGPYATFAALRSALQLPEVFERCGRAWDESQQRYEGESAQFLSQEFVEVTCAFLNMDSRIVDALRRALGLLRANEALMRFAWHGHHMLCRHTFDREHSVGNWPPLPEALGEAGRMLYAFVFLSGAPYLRKLHAARGIPKEVTADTLKDIEVWMRTYEGEHGCLGFDHNGWMMNRFREQLYQLGRLQFDISHYKHDYHVFRNRKTQELLVLAGEGMRFRRDGQCDGANGIHDADGAWTAHYDRDETAVRGCPITREGIACNDSAALALDVWECVLEQGDPALFVHIPGGGPLNHAACVESYHRAVEFFPRHVPEHPFKAFTSGSWLFDHQLREYLPPSSNIVRFMEDWYLFPSPGANDLQMIERVLGPGIDDPLSFPAKTALQKAVVEHMKKGGRWRGAGGLIFPCDIDRTRGRRTLTAQAQEAR